MTIKLLTEYHLELLKKESAQARLSLHLSKCHIVGNHISRLICYLNNSTRLCCENSFPLLLQNQITQTGKACANKIVHQTDYLFVYYSKLFSEGYKLK